jgi:hypothetical protein
MLRLRPPDMGAALNTASATASYLLSDRGTWLSFKNKGDFVIEVEGDKHLFNQYGVMLVNPQKHPHVKRELGQQFIDWLISPEGQRRSPTVRSTARNCSIRTRMIPMRDLTPTSVTTTVLARRMSDHGIVSRSCESVMLWRAVTAP